MWPHLNPHWLAFHDLATERQIGMGPGPIPVSMIKAYAADELGLAGDAAENFVAVIRQMDSGYLDASSPKQTAADKTHPKVAVDDVAGVTNLFSRLESANNDKVPKKKKQKL